MTAPERPDWLPTEAELAQSKADAHSRLLARINALTHEQCRDVLYYLAAWTPEGTAGALDGLAEQDEAVARSREARAEGVEQRG